ncbi:hypothetical protein [Streptomyces sp. NPDC058291]|uniref:hypothetical protein n=1 Tax=Streptomyces sp. NPDC058291 TaxID=3346427 RepID=UPI0036EE1ABC
MAHTVLGGAVGAVWLVLPGMTSGDDVPVAIKEPTPAASAPVAADEAERSTIDLVLPLVAVGAAGAVAGYACIRRVRRTRDRTTPGSVGSPPPPRSSSRSSSRLAVLDEQARAALIAADDRIRAARCELGFAGELFAAEDTALFRRTVEEAGAELAAAFRMRQRYDDGVPQEEAAREHALAGIVGRCAEVERRLDSVSGAFEGLREPGRASGEALVVAEGRFRELTGRVGATEAVLDELRARYAPTATAAVTGSVEQAKDRLLFATVRLNEARQSADSGQPERAARQLRAAEGVIAQAAVLVGGVDRLAENLRAAELLAPQALAAAEAELSRARAQEAAAPDVGAGKRHGVAVMPPVAPPGELHARLLHADAVLAPIRRRLTAPRPPDRGAGDRPGNRPDGPDSRTRESAEAAWDPVGVLRRIVRATASIGSERDGALQAAALLTARTATAAAADYVETHRGAVGVDARTRLAEAQRLLATGDPADRAPADVLAGQARELAELDVRAHGNPYAGPDHTAGVGGAVLGGVVPAEDPDAGTPAGFTGPPRPAVGG